MLRVALLLAVLLLPSTAQASYWLRCEVLADVAKSDKPKYYKVTVRRAEVTEGHMEPGSPCMGSYIGHTLTVFMADRHVPLGEGKTLRYEYYNGRGQDGVITNENWSAPHRLRNDMF